MTRALLLIVALSLAGCAQFRNRVACSVSQDEAYFVSKYSRIGISSDIDPEDAKVLCKAQKV